MKVTKELADKMYDIKILASLRPNWAAEILYNNKRYELRKNYPRAYDEDGKELRFNENGVLKYHTPVKVYIYCTKAGECLCRTSAGNKPFSLVDRPLPNSEVLNGKVVAEFLCDKIVKIPREVWLEKRSTTKIEQSALDSSHVSWPLLSCYAEPKSEIYAWHITNLIVYNNLKELGEFFSACDKPKGTDCAACVDAGTVKCKAVTRAPQSWCRVEVI